MTSKKYRLIKQDLQRIAKNALMFSAPALLIFVVQLQQGVDPRMAGQVALLALYGIVLDAAKKFLTETRYE